MGLIRWLIRALTILALVWVASVTWILTRSQAAAQIAAWTGARCAWIFPTRPRDSSPVGYSVWPPPGSLHFAAGYGEETVRAVMREPYMIVDGIWLLLLVPFHSAACLAVGKVTAVVGIPRASVPVGEFWWRVFWRSAIAGLLWIAVPYFIGAFWLEASDPRHSVAWRAGWGAARMIDADPDTLAVPAWGAFVGYVWCIASIARLVVWQCATPEACRPPWIRACIRCGFAAEPGERCSECGEPLPLLLDRCYFGQWHARLARGRRIDPLLVIVAAAVVFLFAWPLVSGVAATIL